MSLWSEFLAHDGRLMSKWKGYFPPYQRHLARYVDRPVLLFEIGVSGGGSLQLWKRFLGPYARIIGLDNNKACRFEEDQISVRIGSQADPAFLQAMIEEFGVPDVVIDDGSHRAPHQLASFQFLYPRLDRNGVYAVEDVHTSYWATHDGGLRRPGTFMEFSKMLLDELNGRYSDPEAHTSFTDSTLSVCFYDSLVIFERGNLPNRVAPVVGGGETHPPMVFEKRELRRLAAGEVPRQDGASL